MHSSSLFQGKVLGTSLFVTGLATFLFLYSFRPGQPDPEPVKLLKDLTETQITNDDVKEEEDEDTESTPISGNMSESFRDVTPHKKTYDSGAENTPLTSNVMPARLKSKPITDASLRTAGEKMNLNIVSLHSEIEDIDKRGKALFKTKNYMEAAEVFTEALVLIEKNTNMTDKENNRSFNPQVLTLTNNRSAMYEKASLPDLALHDCETILDLDTMHIKARKRKLRILESLSRHTEALVEVCALQLKFMKDNKDKIRMGVQVIPPVPQSKLEELMAHILPKEVEAQFSIIKAKTSNEERRLPSNYTVLQLLQSFMGYNEWMATAKNDGHLDTLTAQIEALGKHEKVNKVGLLLKRGRKYAYHKKFRKCKEDVGEALVLLEENKMTKKEFERTRTHARLWEWAGICRHLNHDLEDATRCYEICHELEPDNVEILVKRAGVKMDNGKQNDALAYFDMALAFDPTATDALLHRANLFMLQNKPEKAKADLEKCLELRPDFTIARLRLATILMTTDKISEAKKCLDLAEKIDPRSSEVHSYRGEMHFSQGDFAEARREFDHAIKYNVENPTPYVNAALVVINTPPSGGGPPDMSQAISLLEKAIQVDPQFLQAYVHLGQLKLSMAMDLTAAKQVVTLYNQGLNYCRTSEEMRDIVSMRILAIAQIDAASMLKMDTLTMQ